MKKILLISLAIGLIFSCQKNPDPATTLQEVSFKAIELTPNAGLKSTADWECKADIPTNAWVVVSGADYYPALFDLDGVLYTQAIKFPVLEQEQYCISKFVLYKEVNGTVGCQVTPATDDVDDIIVYGTPQPGSLYEPYINEDYHFPYCFAVNAFTKAEIPIEVLCYQDADYDKFGFDWFAITEIVIREQCFFGDFCIKHPIDYNSSNYHLQSTWPQTEVPFVDAPAIISLDVYINTTQAGWVEVPHSPFTNNTLAADYGVGAPVCIQYPDNLSKADQFKVVLNILVKQGDAFVFVPFKEWFFNDNQMIVQSPPATDGIVDFVLGSCNLTGTDVQLAPWQNLPPMANVTIENPGSLPSYWDITFNSFDPDGKYDISLGLHDGWCGDEFTTIPNSTFDANIYSSLNDANWPLVMPFSMAQISQINWLMNHLQDYGINPPLIGDTDADAVQHAIWNIMRGEAHYGGDAATMFNDASSHSNFVPLPGGFAAVLIIRPGDEVQGMYQLVFVVVDP